MSEQPPAMRYAAGMPDQLFDHDGLITKRPLRAMALAYLRPRPGELLWDVGTGAGSVAIEWACAASEAYAIGIENKPVRADRAEANAARLGVGDRVRIVRGDAAGTLGELPGPDAVFVGGGASASVLEQCWQALRPGGRLVVHAVTIETQELLTAWYRTHGGNLLRIGTEYGEPLGEFLGWRPARAIVHWSADKP